MDLTKQLVSTYFGEGVESCNVAATGLHLQQHPLNQSYLWVSVEVVIVNMSFASIMSDTSSVWGTSTSGIG
nr:hypothetical protein [Tanacetum cinerariifolium]